MLATLEGGFFEKFSLPLPRGKYCRLFCMFDLIASTEWLGSSNYV